MSMKLNEVIPWGRSFEEYTRMFALTGDDLAETVLGCGDGPASFNAEATVQGIRVVSCDPIYAFDPTQIEQRATDCYDELIAKGQQADFEQVLAATLQRDRQDSSREDSPLRSDESYTVIDTSDLSVERVVDVIVSRVRASLGRGQ